MRTLMTCFFVFMVSLPTTAADKRSAAATKLAAKEGKFTVNGKPTFLYGISYYGTLGAPEAFIEQDLKLGNERNVGDKRFVSMADLRRFRDRRPRCV